MMKSLHGTLREYITRERTTLLIYILYFLALFYCRMCRDILNTCVRNTEEAEKASQAAISGRGMGKGVWGMIEESELAKTFKKGDEKKVSWGNYYYAVWKGFSHVIIFRYRILTI